MRYNIEVTQPDGQKYLAGQARMPPFSYDAEEAERTIECISGNSSGNSYAIVPEATEPPETPEQAHARGVAEERERCAEMIRKMRTRPHVGNIPGDYMSGWIAAVNAALARIT